MQLHTMETDTWQEVDRHICRAPGPHHRTFIRAVLLQGFVVHADGHPNKDTKCIHHIVHQLVRLDQIAISIEIDGAASQSSTS